MAKPIISLSEISSDSDASERRIPRGQSPFGVGLGDAPRRDPPEVGGWAGYIPCQDLRNQVVGVLNNIIDIVVSRPRNQINISWFAVEAAVKTTESVRYKMSPSFHERLYRAIQSLEREAGLDPAIQGAC